MALKRQDPNRKSIRAHVKPQNRVLQSSIRPQSQVNHQPRDKPQLRHAQGPPPKQDFVVVPTSPEPPDLNFVLPYIQEGQRVNIHSPLIKDEIGRFRSSIVASFMNESQRSSHPSFDNVERKQPAFRCKCGGFEAFHLICSSTMARKDMSLQHTELENPELYGDEDTIMDSDDDFATMSEPDYRRETAQSAPGGITSFNYTNMDVVYDVIVERLGQLTAAPRTSILTQIIKIVEPQQQRKYPYETKDKSEVVTPAWWPGEAGDYRSPTRMLDDFRYHLLTYLLMAPCYNKDWAKSACRQTEVQFPRWIDVLRHAYDNTDFKTGYFTQRGVQDENEPTRSRKHDNTDPEVIKTRKSVMQTVLEIAGQVERVEEGEIDRCTTDHIAPMPEGLRRAAYGKSGQARANRARRDTSSSPVTEMPTSSGIHPSKKKRQQVKDSQSGPRKKIPLKFPLKALSETQSAIHADDCQNDIQSNYHRKAQRMVDAGCAMNTHLCASDGWHDLQDDGPCEDFSACHRLIPPYKKPEIEHVNADATRPRASRVKANPIDHAPPTARVASYLPESPSNEFDSQQNSFGFLPDAEISSASTSFTIMPMQQAQSESDNVYYNPDIPDHRSGRPLFMVPEFGSPLDSIGLPNLTYPIQADITPNTYQWESSEDVPIMQSFNDEDTQALQSMDLSIRPQQVASDGFAACPETRMCAFFDKQNPCAPKKWIPEEEAKRRQEQCGCSQCVPGGRREDYYEAAPGMEFGLYPLPD